MRGIVMSYDEALGEGLISGDDGQRYSFRRGGLKRLAPIGPGTQVDFMPHNGEAWEVYVLTPAPVAGPPTGYAALPAAGGPAAYAPTAPANANIFTLYGEFWNRYFDFNGRSRRAAWWTVAIVHGCIGIILYWTMISTLIEVAQDLADSSRYNGYYSSYDPAEEIMDAFQDNVPLFALASLFGLLTFIPNLAILVRRLHDVGWSGWTLLLPLLLVIIGGVLGANGLAPIGGFFALAAIVFAFVQLIFIWFVPGNRDSNQYGPDPRGG